MPRHYSWLMLLLVLVGAPRATAGGIHETDDFADVTTKVREATDRFGVENVLLVCDIDNTLLAMNGDLGSDQWFEWQEHLLENQPGSPRLVAASFEELLDVQGLLFTLGSMRPPQPNLPELIAETQSEGVRTLVLTSRGDMFRDVTERELTANGYDFAKSSLPVRRHSCEPYLPYNLDAIESSGLTAKEAEWFGLRPPREVSFDDGIFMSAGQHKGAMLLTVLARCPTRFKAVVFVDDHGRHVLRVFDALVRRGIDATVLHYQREDDNVQRFRYSDKQAVTERWLRLDRTIEDVFEQAGSERQAVGSVEE